ncbi:MAG: hypothetical protein HXY53_03630 [Nitrospirae bacterium]|nr:hypothetical protein [Nitrospirota bacterium]
MRISYPRKFTIESSIELTYKDYNITVKNNRKYESSYSILEQEYGLGLKGFLIHPKLLVFSSRFTFIDEKTLDSTSQFKPHSDSYIYELSAVFLPYRPINLTTYATISDYSFGGIYGDGSIYDMKIINYGAILGINLRKLPLIRFEYYHMNIESPPSRKIDRETTSDSFYLNIRGILNKLRTQYSLNFGYSDIQTQKDNRENKYANIYTNTDLKKFKFVNFFKYYDQESSNQESSKNFGIYTNLQAHKWKNFSHEYHYIYEKYENKTDILKNESEREEIRGFFTYRFAKNLYSSLSMNYGIINERENEYKFDSIFASLNYSKPFKKYHLYTYYNFIQRNNELKGEYTQHSINLQVTTRKYRWGTIYLSYSFHILNGTFKIYEEEYPYDFYFEDMEVKEGKYESMTNTFTLGVRGRALKKAPWSLEVEYYNSSSSKERPKKYFDYSYDYFESSMLKTEIEKNYYVFLGQIFYPIGRKGATLNLRSGYNFGEIDSIGSSKTFYEVKFNFPFSRRLRLLSWWREMWYNYDIGFDRKVREYEISLSYRVAKVYLSAEYWAQNQEENNRERNYRRFIIKLRRSF